MKTAADAMAAVLAHYRAMVAFGVLLDDMANIAEAGARFDQANAQAHAFECDLAHALRLDRRLADKKHLAGVTVKLVLDDSDVDIDDITVFQLLVAGYTVAHLVVDRGADRFREAVVIQRCRNRFLHINDIVVANTVELIRGHTGLDVRTDHLQDFAGKTPGDTHFFDFRSSFYKYGHVIFLLFSVAWQNYTGRACYSGDCFLWLDMV